jgi:MFS family permease
MKTLRWWDYVTMNIYWLGLNIASGSLTPYILPLLVAQLVGEASKGTALGGLRVATMAVAILVQAAAGVLSDRSTLRWGRRRPFIVVGTVLDLVFLGLVGLAGIVWRDYWLLVAAVMLLQVSSNLAHGALQGLIPDVVPEQHRGKASGLKAAFELLPIILVGLTIARYVKDNPWAAIITVMGALFVGMLLTLPVREQPLREKPTTPVAPQLARTAALTAIFVVVTGLFGALVGVVGQGLSGTGWLQLAGVTVAGLVAMAGSIILGVYWSVRVGIGQGARERPAYIWWVINRLLFLAAVGSIQTFAQYFLGDVLHVPDPAAATGNLMLVVGVSTLIAALISGFLADRFGRRRLVAGAGLLAALGTFLLVLSPNMTMVLVSGCLIGISAGTFLTSNWALGTDLVPPGEAGRYLGVSNLAGAGAGIVGAGLGGPMADFFNRSSPGLGYLVIFGIYGACFLLSALTLLKVPEARAGRG